MEKKILLAEGELKNLPLIPLPKELENLPCLAKEQEETMRLFAREAIRQILDGILQKPDQESILEGSP